MNKREIEQCIRDEVAEWPGVSVEFTSGGSHPKAKLMFGDKALFRAFGGNQSFVAYPHKMIADMRAVMEQLGASRNSPPPAKEEVDRVHRERNDAGVAARPDPVARQPVDPKPNIADQLVATGAATPEQAKAARVSIFADDDDDADQPTESDAEREARLAALQAQIDAIVDGIYFDLPDEVYHGVRALGSGSICDLIVSPGTFWRGSWLDPNRPELDEEQTAAQLVGKAYHIARLESEKFLTKFVRQISKTDYPAKGMLTSDQAVKSALKAMGQQQTFSGESTAERAERLADLGYDGTILPLEKARWQATVQGCQPLAGQIFDQIEEDMTRLRGSQEIAEKLTGGFAEVSVFWTDRHGIKCKARFDYLSVQLWDDFKTFANPNGKVLAQAIADAFRYNRYYIQAIHYRDAAEEIRLGGLQIIGDATDDQRKMIAELQIKPDDLECWYIFQEKGGVPNLLARRFEFFEVPRGTKANHAIADGDEEAIAEVERVARRSTGIHSLGRAEIEQAKRQFVLYSQIYAPGQPWAPIEPLGTIGDLDFNSHWLEGR